MKTLAHVNETLSRMVPTGITGSVVRTTGMTIEVGGFAAPVGAEVAIDRQGTTALAGQVIGFRDEFTLVYPLGEVDGVRRGSHVALRGTAKTLRVGPELLGRVVDARGNILDDAPQPCLIDRADVERRPPAAMSRPSITQPLATGVRAIDSLLTTGRGGRIGIFAGSGVGKSVLLGMMTRYTEADVCVIGLIGERGREVNDFIQRDLGAAGLAKSVVVASTSDEPALLRIQAAKTATAIAEYFRDQGKDVLLVLDSLTRVAMAQREIGLAAGEPPTTRGYPPSMFALLPKIVERAGRTDRGSITGFYSVLTEGDDLNEPVSDTVRGLLDGHVVLSRKLAARGHYPAIDVLESVSRLMPDVVDTLHEKQARDITKLLAAYRQHGDLISIGAYQRGSNELLDRAIETLPAIEEHLRQPVAEGSNFRTTLSALATLCEANEDRTSTSEQLASAGRPMWR